MEVRQTLKGWVDHVANGCCHVYMRLEKHDQDFTRYVVVETLNQISETFAELPTDFYRQVEELKQNFQIDLQQTDNKKMIVGEIDKRPSKILQILKTERGVPDKTIATILDCSTAQGEKILNGESSMSPAQIVAAAKRFSVSPAAFYREAHCSIGNEDLIVRASLEFQLLENMEALPIEKIDCLINCSHAIVKLHRIYNSKD